MDTSTTAAQLIVEALTTGFDKASADFAQGMAQLAAIGVAAASQLDKTFSDNSKAIIDTMQQLGVAFQQRTVQPIQQGVGILDIAIGTTLGGVFMGALQQLMNVGREGYEAAKSYERLSLSLVNLVAREKIQSGEAKTMSVALDMSAGKAKELLQWVQVLAIKSPFTQEGTAQAFKMAMSFGFNADEAKRLTQNMIDFTSATGAQEMVMTRVAYALGQIRAAGRLMGQDMMQLTQAGIPMMQVLAEKLGKTTAEIQKMKEAGKISSQDAIAAVNEYIEKYYAGAAATQANALAGLESSLHDIKQVLERELVTPALKQIQPVIVDLMNALQDPQVVAGIQAIGKGLGNAAAAAINLVKQIAQMPPAVRDVATAVGVLIAVVRLASGSFNPLIDMVKDLGKGLLWVAVTGIPGLIQGLLNMQAMMKIAGGAGAWIQIWVQQIGSALIPALGAGATAAGGFAAAVKTAAVSSAVALAPLALLAAAVILVVKTLNSAYEASQKTNAELYKMATANTGNLIEDAFSRAGATIEYLINGQKRARDTFIAHQRDMQEQLRDGKITLEQYNTEIERSAKVAGLWNDHMTDMAGGIKTEVDPAVQKLTADQAALLAQQQKSLPIFAAYTDIIGSTIASLRDVAGATEKLEKAGVKLADVYKAAGQVGGGEPPAQRIATQLKAVSDVVNAADPAQALRELNDRVLAEQKKLIDNLTNFSERFSTIGKNMGTGIVSGAVGNALTNLSTAMTDAAEKQRNSLFTPESTNNVKQYAEGARTVYEQVFKLAEEEDKFNAVQRQYVMIQAEIVAAGKNVTAEMLNQKAALVEQMDAMQAAGEKAAGMRLFEAMGKALDEGRITVQQYELGMGRLNAITNTYSSDSLQKAIAQQRVYGAVLNATENTFGAAINLIQANKNAYDQQTGALHALATSTREAVQEQTRLMQIQAVQKQFSTGMAELLKRRAAEDEKTAEDHSRALQNIEQQYQDRIRQIKDQYGQTEEDAIRNRDALALARAREEKGKALAQAGEDRERAQRDLQQQEADKQKSRDTQRAEEEARLAQQRDEQLKQIAETMRQTMAAEQAAGLAALGVKADITRQGTTQAEQDRFNRHNMDAEEYRQNLDEHKTYWQTMQDEARQGSTDRNTELRKGYADAETDLVAHLNNVTKIINSAIAPTGPMMKAIDDTIDRKIKEALGIK